MYLAHRQIGDGLGFSTDIIPRILFQVFGIGVPYTSSQLDASRAPAHPCDISDRVLLLLIGKNQSRTIAQSTNFHS